MSTTGPGLLISPRHRRRRERPEAPDRRPLLVGMNNPISLLPEHALYPAPDGCAGARLWRLLESETGAGMRDYLRAFERVNLVTGPWDAGVARCAADDLQDSGRLRGRRVVLLGREVARAFAFGSLKYPVPWLNPLVGEGTIFYPLPHPSGRNTWYNSEDNRRAAAQLLAYLYRESR